VLIEFFWLFEYDIFSAIKIKTKITEKKMERCIRLLKHINAVEKYLPIEKRDKWDQEQYEKSIKELSIFINITTKKIWKFL